MPALLRQRSDRYECGAVGWETVGDSETNQHHIPRKFVDWDSVSKNKKIVLRWTDSRNQLLDEKFNTTTLREFKYLSAKWKKETGGHSVTYQITKNKNYQYIIDMGEKVVPLIFMDLQNEVHYWFEVLYQILRPEQDPVLKKHYGDLDKMAEDWLRWGKQHNYLR